MNVNVLIIEDDFRIAYIHKEMGTIAGYGLHTSLHAKMQWSF